MLFSHPCIVIASSPDTVFLQFATNYTRIIHELYTNYTRIIDELLTNYRRIIRIT